MLFRIVPAADVGVGVRVVGGGFCVGLDRTVGYWVVEAIRVFEGGVEGGPAEEKI